MQVAHPIIALTIDNNWIYSIVIDNNRTRTGNIKNMVLVQNKGMQVAHPIIAPTIDTKGSEKGPIMVTMTMTNDSGKWQMTMTVTMTKMAKGRFLE